MIKPLGARLLVEAIKPEEIKLSSGILISPEWDSAPESIKATVLALGPDVQGFAVGDVILVAQFAPTAAKTVPTDKTFIVPAEDILAIVTPDKSAK